MQELNATKAREIDKASVTEAESLLVDGALSTDTSKPVMQAGDFYFRTQFVPDGQRNPSQGFWRRLLFKLVGVSTHQLVTTKTVYTVVMSCPFCGLPIMTTAWQNHITSKQPLTHNYGNFSDHSNDNGFESEMICELQVQGGSLTNIVAGAGDVAYRRRQGPRARHGRNPVAAPIPSSGRCAAFYFKDRAACLLKSNEDCPRRW